MPRVNVASIDLLKMISTQSFTMYQYAPGTGDDNPFAGHLNEALSLFNEKHGRSYETETGGPRSPETTANEELDKDAKAFAGKLYDDFSAMKERLIEDGADKHKLQLGMIEGNLLALESIKKGFNIVTSEAYDEGYKMLWSAQPQMKASKNPQDWEDLEEKNKVFPLSEFFNQTTSLQRKKIDYLQDKQSGSLDPEKEKEYLDDLYRMNKDLNALSKNMIETGKTSEAAQSMFGKKDYFLSEKQGFIGTRGLQAVEATTALGMADRDAFGERKDEIISSLDAGMRKFSAKRAFFFGKNTDEYTDLMKAASDLQKTMHALKTGRDANGMKLSAQDREKLVHTAKEQAETVEGYAEKYINAKSVDRNREHPHTPAGKDRFEGAKSIREIAREIKAGVENYEKLGQERKMEAGGMNLGTGTVIGTGSGGRISEMDEEELSNKLGMGEKERRTVVRPSKPAPAPVAGKVLENDHVLLPNSRNSLKSRGVG